MSARHDLGMSDPLGLSTTWRLPREEHSRGVWRVSGSLLGLDVALARLALRRIDDGEMPRAPRLSTNGFMQQLTSNGFGPGGNTGFRGSRSQACTWNLAAESAAYVFPAKPVASVTSSRPGRGPDRAVDGDPATAWECDAEDGAPRLTLDLAARISTHREAVSREMSALAKQKLVERRGGALLLHDLVRDSLGERIGRIHLVCGCDGP